MLFSYVFPDKSLDSIGPLTDTVKAMDVETLRDNLKKLGFEAGPITPSTHTVYMRQLLRLRKNPCQVKKDQSCKSATLLLSLRANGGNKGAF